MFSSRQSDLAALTDDYRTDPPFSTAYSIIVSRESVRIIELVLASLNDLEIFAYDIGDAYPNFK